MKPATLCIVLLAAILPPAFPPARADEPARVMRVYELHNVRSSDAFMKVQSACPECLDAGMDIKPEGDFLRVNAPQNVQERVAKLLAELDVPPPQARFLVVFLDALDKSLPPPELPPTVRTALDDVRTLFPFKGYAIRHTALLNTGVHAFARVGGEYDVTMSAEPREGKTFFVRGFMVRRASSDTTILANEFPIRVGETVVLGMSRSRPAAPDPEAPRALIVLVTALP